jgi:glycosyltransferase involved in cell wall biosynthesis
LRALFLIPGDIDRKTGGYGYDRRVITEASAHGVTLEPVRLGDGFPFPSDKECADTIDLIKSLPHGIPLLIDGLAFGAFDQAMLGALNGPIVALVHHPLAYENGIPADKAAALKASERAALRRADAIIVTSAPTKSLLVTEFGVPETKIRVAVPGTDAAPFAQGSGLDAPAILGVGSLTPRKAWSVLIAALSLCRDADWTMRIVGAGPERATLLEQIETAGLQTRIHLLGEVDETALAEHYNRADLFIMPSLYEGFGMALTEALARGLPSIASDGVVALQHLPEDAAQTVQAGDVESLALAIKTLLAPEARLRVADKARLAAASLPRWDTTARIITDTIRSVAR